MTILLIAEHDNETLSDQTNKALTAAKEIGGDVHVLVAGKDALPENRIVEMVPTFMPGQTIRDTLS